VNARNEQPSSGGAGFRLKTLLAMMIVVAAITALGLYFVQRNLAAEAARDLQQQFEQQLTALHNLQEVRHAALAERCRALVSKPRIHAALEDNALDLLYPSARDELRDVMQPNRPGETRTLRAEFYRFLDNEGHVIPAGNSEEVGPLAPEEERKLALNTAPREQQLGYFTRATTGGETVAEIIAMPIISTETGEPIAALALGFKPIEPSGKRVPMKSGIWTAGHLYLAGIPDPARNFIEQEMTKLAQSSEALTDHLNLMIDRVPHLLFFKRLNPGSLYPLASEVCLFPLTDLQARQNQVRWQILTAGAAMILAGFFASHFASARLSKPVEKLARDSEVDRAQRQLAEVALEHTNVELQRSVRFSADASHQLKTPVAVLRAGLEELLARDALANDAREEISQLVHQTYRLNGVIEDLLLLSRMDAGRLRLSFTPVDLSQLVEAELDDLSAHSQDDEIIIDAKIPAGIEIAGEKRYTTMIVRNLLENARKYNRRGGCIRVTARQDERNAFLNIANTGPAIPSAAREFIFERFHRGSAGENIPGHGLGLNLARELARLHGGDVQLIRSEENWTEFQIRFRLFDPKRKQSA
jgi:signal transduction histidine kinase